MFQTLCCNIIDHKELKIQSICISPNCTLDSRLMCMECLGEHKLHNNFQETRFEELINLQSTNLIAKQVVQLFQSVKVRVMSLLNDIESQLIEKTKYIKQPAEFDEILNDIINNNEFSQNQIHQFLNKLIKIRIQEENSIQKFGFSRLFLQYIEKFNNWMASVPEFRVQEERVNILKGQITAYGKPLTYKISKNQQLVSSITLFENCYLKGLSFGQVEAIDNLSQEMRIMVLLGQNFNNVIYKETFNIQNATKDDFNFSKQIILLKSNCYTIVVSSNSGTFAIRALAESGQINPFLKYEKEQRYLNTKEQDNIIQALYIADIIIQLIKI